MPGIFLSAEWRHLAMLNYEVDPAILKSRVPPGTEIDLFEGPPEVPRFPQWLSAPCEHPRASVRRDCRGAIAACVRDHIRVEMVTGIFLRHEAVEEVADDYGLVMGGNQDRESTRYLRERGW